MNNIRSVIFKNLKNTKRNRSNIIKEINSEKYNLAQLDINRRTPLMYICENNMSEVALALIQTGQSKPEQVDDEGNTALIWSCYNNMSEVALALIETGQSNPGQVDESGYTALLWACSGNMPEVALALIQTGQSKPEQVDEKGHTALLWACLNNMSEVALALIETGQSNPGQVDEVKNTALIYACKNNMSEVALALIQTGQSKPEQVDKKGYTALIYACDKKMSEVALALIQTGQSNLGQVDNTGNTALMSACDLNMLEVALALIQTGQSKPEQVDHRGNTALILACYDNMSEAAMALIHTGQSNPGQVDATGNTALIYACKNNMSEVALALIETGESNPEHIDPYDNNALNYAEINDMEHVIRLLKDSESEEILNLGEFNLNANGFNVMYQETAKIDDYLKRSRDNLCFKINDSYFLVSKQEILTQFNNKENIKFGCKEVGNEEHYLLDENILYNKKYLTMSALLGLQILVDVQKIRDIMADRTSNTFYLSKTNKVPGIISQAYLDGGGGIGADYCQEGKARDVYNIIKAEPVYSETESLPEQPIEATETREIKIQYKTYTFSFPITETTTIEEMKTALLEKLVSENLITSTNQNVKFIYKGKIYTDGSVALSSLENPPFNITLQAMVSPRVGGTKKYRKMRKSGNRKTKKIYQNNKIKKTERKKRKRNKYTRNKK